jgi:hypothetical protein
MKKYIFILMLLLYFAFISCESKLVEWSEPGKLEKIQLSDLSNIPLSYGKLMNVTTQADLGGWYQLWFEDENNIIRVVRVALPHNRIHPQVLVIPRN